jgi:hypothetical protein
VGFGFLNQAIPFRRQFLPIFHIPYSFSLGNAMVVAPALKEFLWWHAVAQLEHCATTREVAGSIPNGVTGNFH